jgi:hypothetical protein
MISSGFLLSKKPAREPGLADHRCKGIWLNFAPHPVSSNIHKMHYPGNLGTIAAVARGSLPMLYEAVCFNDFDEIAKRAF